MPPSGDGPAEPYSLPVTGRPVNHETPLPEGAWNHMWPRREVLRLGALLAAGGAIAPLLAACASPAGTEIASGAPGGAPRSAALSGTVTLLAEGSDPSTEPSLKRVYDDFKTQNAAVDWDIRAIPGLGPDWDRLARAA